MTRPHDLVPGFRLTADETFVCEVCGQEYLERQWAEANPTASVEDVERYLTWGLADHRASCHILD